MSPTPVIPDAGATVVVALGGNALLRRDEKPSAEAQRRNVAAAADAVARLAHRHRVVVTHGNGPQVGILALRASAAEGGSPLDVLGAETEGMIGYVVGQELGNRLPDHPVAALLTQVEVDPDDPAFAHPTKPIGPVYDDATAREVARTRGWEVTREGEGWRRVVASPEPRRILEVETLKLLVEHGVLVICAGGGGIPVIFDEAGRAHGVEAVIDKDRTAALLARQLGADALLLLTDVDGVYLGWGTDGARRLDTTTLEELPPRDRGPGSMGPKVEACADFADATGGLAAIGALTDAEAILQGRAGTRVTGRG